MVSRAVFKYSSLMAFHSRVNPAPSLETLAMMENWSLTKGSPNMGTALKIVSCAPPIPPCVMNKRALGCAMYYNNGIDYFI